MLPHVSWVQKCPLCGKYFMLETSKSREGEDYSFEKGELTYPEIREAWAQLKDSLAEKVKISLMLEYVWAYNDAYQRDSFEREKAAPTPEATEEFRGVIRELVAIFPVETKLIHAEYLREAGLFDEAMAIVDEEGEPEQPVYKILAETIRQKCGHKDTSVGLVRYE